MDTTLIAAFQDILAHAPRILLCTHRAPDGDGFSAMIGLFHALITAGKRVTVYCPEGPPGPLAFLPGSTVTVALLDSSDRFDATLILDTSSDDLLPMGLPDAANRGQTVFIDHHMEQESRIDGLRIKRVAPATGEILFDLIKSLGLPLDRSTAICLYTSIVSDTASFRYAVTTPHTHRVAAELIALGARPSITAENLFEKFPLYRRKLLGALLCTVQIDSDARLAWITADAATLDRFGASTADLDGMVNAARALNGIDVAALFAETGDGVFAEIRARGNTDLDRRLAALGTKGPRHGRKLHFHGKTLHEAADLIRRTLIATAPANNG